MFYARHVRFVVGRVFMVAGLLLVAGNVSAAPYTVGNIFASVNNGLVREYTPLGVLVQTLNTTLGGFTTGSAFDSTGNFYVTDFSASAVSRFDGNGALTGTFGSGYSTPESIVFDVAGNAYVGNLGNGIRQFDAAGNFVQSFSAGRVDWLDLAADQQTMFFTNEGTTIQRWNLATNSALATFATGLENAFALRILGDGGVLVADRSNIKRFDAAGNLIQTYDMAGQDHWFSLNLDPDGTTFWSGDFGTGTIARFSIATGAVLGSFAAAGSGSLYGISLFGEITQGTGGGAVPEPSSLMLLGLGGALFGVRRWRRRTRAA